MNDRENTSAHSTDAELTGFLDRTLEAPVRARIAEHLDECHACREAVAIAAATLAEPPSGASLHWLGPMVAAAAIVVLVVLPASWMSTQQDVVSPLRTESSEGTPRFSALQPANGQSTGARPAFRWEAAGDGATYELTLTDEVGDLVWSGRTTESRLTLPDTLSLDPGTYHWVVDALLESARSATTGINRFRVGG